MQHLLDYHQALIEAVNALHQGQVIGYPTEAVYGLGADPFNQHAVNAIIAMKQRDPDKGMILVASSWDQIDHLIAPINPLTQVDIEASWPGPVTWVFPATDAVPHWVRGRHQTVAIRISAHPVVQDLCRHFGKPIISTSANLEGFPAIRDQRTLEISFGNDLACIVPGQLGGAKNPSQIIDASTHQHYR